jgi:hypothetical protein
MNTPEAKPKSTSDKPKHENKINDADVAEDTNVLLKVYEMQWIFLRQTEDQRTQITNMVLLIASAVTGFIAQKGLGFDVLPLTILLIALGLYGALISEKMYERFGFFRQRADTLEKKLEALAPGVELGRLWQQANEMNAREFPRLNKLRLHHLWLVLHLGIAAGGIILTVLAVFVH